MARDFIKLPTLEELPSLSEGFFNLAPEAGTVLVVDGSFIPINKPSVNGTKYFCRKKYYAINVLCFCGFQGKKFDLLQAAMEKSMISGYIEIPIISKIMSRLASRISYFRRCSI